MGEENRTVRDPLEIASPGLRDPARHRLDAEDKGTATYVAKNITKLREERGWSKTDLARKLSEQGWEVPRQTIHKMETLQRTVSAEDVWELSRAFNVAPGVLFARSNQSYIESLYEKAIDTRLEAVNRLAFYRVAQMRLKKALEDAQWLPETAQHAYSMEAAYPYEELQKDSDEIVVAFEIGEDL